MYIDASAIVAILTNESDAGSLLAKLEGAKKPIFYSSMTAFEAVLSLSRQMGNAKVGQQAPIPPEFIETAQQKVESFLSLIAAREMPIGGKTHRAAIDAARNFGKFVAHPARLNMGDCFVYACAKEYRLPLLFKGDDFIKTDIETV
ncbi:type II toxin-antitoxin system VapC family toxin [Agrobacterium fabrum]|uniref:type II toxin-antitoxin system VapC family toxin n=1 Tax=Agrobacterium fabrum TaxID=1176649 RepID=UPI0015749C15|nr:type II toxin-antitoxin system VapC family toxin [Agrobacterium fabrum]WIE30883.1 type II toxin-antitoxin system VapC family toxin [Agrobacterium fabrum]WIE46830.1 type II toxin-antitoxin system VapC family toxin [Agrobacterium fabrum]